MAAIRNHTIIVEKVGASGVVMLTGNCVSAALLKTPRLPWSLQKIENIEGGLQESPNQQQNNRVTLLMQLQGLASTAFCRFR